MVKFSRTTYFENSTNVNIMKSKQQRIEQLLHEKTIRKQSLDLTLEYEEEFLEKMGKKGLQEFRDFCLDRIIYVDKQIEKLSKN